MIAHADQRWSRSSGRLRGSAMCHGGRRGGWRPRSLPGQHARPPPDGDLAIAELDEAPDVGSGVRGLDHRGQVGPTREGAQIPQESTDLLGRRG
jgi:hypothetical protein